VVVPSTRTRSRGGHGVTYTLAQAFNCLVWLERLSPHDDDDELIPVRSALVESALINLRALVGFLYADPRGVNKKTKHDVRPSWFTAGATPWSPRGKRLGETLRLFEEAVGGTAAHTGVRSTAHPGHWPVEEGLLVVSREMRSFHEFLKTDNPKELRRFRTPAGSLEDVLIAIDTLRLHPYKPRKANMSVRRVQRRLRTQLGWPKT
jgi:hypothetical protein